MEKFSNDELKKLLAKAIDEEYVFLVIKQPGVLSDLVIKDEGDGYRAVVARNILDEQAQLIAYLLNHAATLAGVSEAFMDVMDGVKEHEIKGMTGLTDHRCKEVYRLASDLLNS